MDKTQWVAEWFADAFEMRFNRKWDDLPEETKDEWFATAKLFLEDLNELTE